MGVRGRCFVNLNKEIIASAVYVWAKRAVVAIPDDVEWYEEG